MSSCPGSTLEDFLAWNFDLVVEDQRDPNFSLNIAEALGNIAPRPRMNREQFKKLVALFEHHREMVEYKLEDFDEDNQSWRDYAGGSFDFITDAEYKSGRLLMDEIVTCGVVRIYAAGPEVFAPNGVVLGAAMKAHAKSLGMSLYFPLDFVSISSNRREIAKQIKEANCTAIQECDILIASARAFRGASMDDGTAFEVGYADARGKDIYLYETNAASHLVKVIESSFTPNNIIEPGKRAFDLNGWEIEPFGLPVNLMPYFAAKKFICGSVYACLEYIAGKTEGIKVWE